MLSLITHQDCLAHDPGGIHPDSPRRLEAIQDEILSSGLDGLISYHDAPLASRELLCLAHDQAYVDHVFAVAPNTGNVHLDGDTEMTPATLPAALRAAGAGALAVDLVMAGNTDVAFCMVRPPGHHAGRANAMGFCVFNNAAIAALHALHNHGLERVAILDFDVHHGNGTEEIVRGDSRVLFCSAFQHPFYPHTGHPSATPNLVDAPLEAGATGKEFRAVIEQKWLPAVTRFQPQLIVLSAGFDGHVLDDMSGIRLLEDDYAWLTRAVKGLAGQFADGRIVSVLEGGYEPGALARSVVAHLKALL
ncbi:MAG: histone deacetylase family protein [Anderseniella sp.]|nr:histone deacetylase family protein [Anderseniella sp.]